MIRIFKHYISFWLVLLLSLELVAFFASVYGGVALRFLESPRPDLLHSPPELHYRALVFALVMVISMTATGRYSRLMENGVVGEALKVGLSFIIGMVAMSLLFYIFPDLILGRGVFGYVMLCSLASVVAIRWFYYALIKGKNVLARRVLVVGTGLAANSLSSTYGRGRRINYQVVGYWPVVGEEVQVEASLLLDLKGLSLLETVRYLRVHDVVVASRETISSHLFNQILECKINGIHVTDLLGFLEQEHRLVEPAYMSHQWWLLQSDGLNMGTLRHVLKRSFDILASSLLLLTLWPFMLLTALAVALECGGREPVFYRQKRLGFGGREIELIKFRSMYSDAEGDGIPRWAQPNDNRITRVGRFIRKTRLDELPQLWNVLRGEMSLVGPRPERPEFVSQLKESIPFYMERLRVKPGITGWAQICLGYGASSEDAMEKLRYDLYYVKNHSLFLDLLVLMQSVEVVLFGRETLPP
ncbi:MAG: TIGR03013 family PEP-CTERM/XrtA system glycosyltransferase [Magnetococcales bacterium]|nr:TIGR03013 family PEP-CTERM/XrtA system glycosyltransferase [Magnetococcales bacterium]NGZ27234.1 TIGR03013 family PEP-CTERM/XrtA system glycosyltransferase [Magnetococcales bacterium]